LPVTGRVKCTKSEVKDDVRPTFIHGELK